MVSHGAYGSLEREREREKQQKEFRERTSERRRSLLVLGFCTFCARLSTFDSMEYLGEQVRITKDRITEVTRN